MILAARYWCKAVDNEDTYEVYSIVLKLGKGDAQARNESAPGLQPMVYNWNIILTVPVIGLKRDIFIALFCNP